MEPTPSPGRELAPWLTPLRFAGLVVLLLLVAYPKVLLGFDSFYYRDYGVLGYPCIYYHHAAFWRGELPLWNPLSNCGTPFLAQWGTMALYPFSLFYLVFPLPWSLTYFCFGHLLLGSLGIYVLTFRWTRSRLAAGLAGTIYVFNGVTFSCLAWPNYLVALGWMPWVILGAERAWSKGGRAVAIAAVIAGLQLLAGVPEVAVLTWIVAGSLWVRALAINADARLVIMGRLLFVIFLAAGLVAAQVLPFLDLLLHSQRDRTFSISKWAMPSWGWANFLVPLFHCFETPQGPFFQQGQEFFGSYYLGAGALGLAGWGIWKSRDARACILAGLSLAAVFFAMGENSFLFPLIKRAFPLANIARYPVKFLILPALAVPLIAAFAVARLETSECRESRSHRGLILISGLAASLLGVVLVMAKLHPLPYDQWDVTLRNGIVRADFLASFTASIVWLSRVRTDRSRAILAIALLLVVFLDARTHTPEQNPSIQTDAFAPGLWQAHGNAAGPKAGQSRVFITPDAERHLFGNNVPRALDQFLGQRLALWSNLNLLDEIPKVNGSSTLQIREQKQLEKRLYEQTNGLPSGLLDFLGVSHISSPENLVEWVGRSNYCPFVTGGQRLEFADDLSTFRGLLDPDFDPRKNMFLPIELKSTIRTANCPQIQISKVEFSSHRIAFQVSTAEAAPCVIAQSFYHCWKASIDGRSVPLLRANGAFQAVLVPAGAHVVILSYRDAMFWTGLTISILSLLICGVLWRIFSSKKEEAA